MRFHRTLANFGGTLRFHRTLANFGGTLSDDRQLLLYYSYFSDWSVSDTVKIRQNLAFLIFYKNCGLIRRLRAKCLLKIARLIVEYTLNLHSNNNYFLAQILGYKSNPFLTEIWPVFQKKKIDHINNRPS